MTLNSHAVGNPQQLGQKPLTFPRQVLSLCMAPFLLEHPKVAEMFPQDAIDRARQLLGYVGSVGAYSDSRGAAGIRQEVANFIERRDG
jgi:glutamate--glyoxylate aminotransferase